MATINLGSRHQELLRAVIKHSSAQVNWDTVASEANCKTPKYARDQFAIIRTKLSAVDAGVVNLGDRHQELLRAVAKNMTAEIPWDVVAKDANCKTAKYARDQFAIVRAKLSGVDPAKKKRKNDDANDMATDGGANADAEAETPVKRPKRTVKTKKISKPKLETGKGVANADDSLAKEDGEIDCGVKLEEVEDDIFT
ncbi:hypothetical protein BAUCODRAFT_38950 [Baudoinia panamericana UAMH 10762]|uniref:Uncharacterized protein n=1 Tax=Baudoinia panamericana (strain UAMH 10762) TaxID=717646 RepID=M2LCV7_BAUPA|nr:uncharacterized protein BAUCODRAFT_38950 [Baudoinia panamericana UAMH 10762]EMC91812.1 hypothetical protein BAUCODRAFT_38950 [Baudoinia panamericana UAMH 10762]